MHELGSDPEVKSVLGNYWRRKGYDENLVSQIKQSFNVDDLTAQMVSSRVDSAEQVGKFLDPKIKDHLPDPFHLLDMDKAVSRVVSAIKNKEKICIFADYDVDGATSAALLKRYFDEIQVQAGIYVPDRIAEGYGPTAESMHTIKSSGYSLVITVDCGSLAFEALEYSSEIGLDMVVLDHHIGAEVLPKAIAIVNPNRLDETSEYKNLAAVGVSFLFVVALNKTLKETDFFTHDFKSPDVIKYLDLVALGTVCDVMTLTGLNRTFVAQGLKVAKKRTNIGYKVLAEVAAIDEAINCYHLGFVLGPRINAGGRVGKSSLGANLLSTTNEEEAYDIAKELEKYNQERKAIEFAVMQEAIEIAKLQEDNDSIFVVGSGWHQGVIGIVAGRLKEKYNKPVAVIAVIDGIAKASCRSVKGVDYGGAILEAKLKGYISAGGGHEMAAGFTASEDKLEELKEFLSARFASSMKDSSAHITKYYEYDLTTSSVNFDLLDKIKILEPFGNGNVPPTFRFSEVFVLKADVVANNHIRFILAPTQDAYGHKALKGIAFNAVGTPIADALLSAKARKLDVLGQLKLNKWQDSESIQLQLADIFYC